MLILLSCTYVTLAVEIFRQIYNILKATVRLAPHFWIFKVKLTVPTAIYVMHHAFRDCYERQCVPTNKHQQTILWQCSFQVYLMEVYKHELRGKQGGDWLAHSQMEPLLERFIYCLRIELEFLSSKSFTPTLIVSEFGIWVSAMRRPRAATRLLSGDKAEPLFCF
jgi:hypothetical protein